MLPVWRQQICTEAGMTCALTIYAYLCFFFLAVHSFRVTTSVCYWCTILAWCYWLVSHRNSGQWGTYYRFLQLSNLAREMSDLVMRPSISLLLTLTCQIASLGFRLQALAIWQQVWNWQCLQQSGASIKRSQMLHYWTSHRNHSWFWQEKRINKSYLPQFSLITTVLSTAAQHLE